MEAMQENILIVAGDAHRDAWSALLAADGYAATGTKHADAQHQLIRESYAVILIEVQCSIEDLARLIADVRRRAPHSQFITLLSDKSSQAAAVLHAGAYDYINIAPLDHALLLAAIQRAMEKAKLIHSNRLLSEKVRLTSISMQSLENKLMRLSVQDEITQLYTRRHFHEILDIELSRAHRHNHPFCLLLLTVDHFAEYIRAHGEKAGDLLLYSFAQLLRKYVRTSDQVARYDRSEFALLLPETTNEGGRRLIERLRDGLTSHPFPGVETLPAGAISFSAKIANFPEDGKNGATLLGLLLADTLI